MLILAGVTITLVLGEDGIIAQAKLAAERVKEEEEKAQADLNKLAGDIQNWVNGGSGGSGAEPTPETSTPTPEETTPKIPEGLKVGSTVAYNPSGNYTWKAKYCSSDLKETEGDVQLSSASVSSASESNFNISSWKVLSIDEGTGNVELVPSAPTEGKVRLQGAQGYNNAVKLLNEACSKLYGNETKKITARSISIEDIEKYMTEEAKNSAKASPPYDTQVGKAYSQSNSDYPAIYAQENKSVINVQKEEGGLGMSSQNEFIERNATVQEPTSESTEVTRTATNGKVKATTSIQPYMTYWYKDATFMTTAFKTYEENTGKYYDLIMPLGTNTTYWVASRCVITGSDNCHFRVRIVNSGTMGAGNMIHSNNVTSINSLALFPVVTLSSELIEGTGGESFEVR